MTNNLKEALIKDFRQLYQKEFTTDWKAQRMIRELEIGVMSLDNTEALINQKEKELLERAEAVVLEDMAGCDEYTVDPESVKCFYCGETKFSSNHQKDRVKEKFKQLKKEVL